jgi:hypothetical protein
MAYNLVLSLPTPATVPADGWIVGYKPLGDPGAYTVAGPFMSMPIVIATADPVGTLYEGYIRRDCGTLESTDYFWQTPCNCVGAGYVESPGGLQCELNEEEEPTVTNSGYCLATSQNGAYTNFGARIYTGAFTNTDIQAAWPGAGAGIHSTISTDPYWANPTSNSTIGPLNREGVWIDSDCNGTKDGLSAGVQTTIAYVYNNPGAPKTIYMGVAGDNQFSVVVNGTEVANSGPSGPDIPFKVWHIIPIDMATGPNYINVIGTGDGSVNDAMGMIVYDETDPTVFATADDDTDLNIVFASHTLRGTSFDVATCPTDYSLDTSGGAGNYICRKTTYKSCNTLA